MENLASCCIKMKKIPHKNVLKIYISYIYYKFFLVEENFLECANNTTNHNYNKIVKSDWLSTALISALIGQFNRTVRVMPK